MRKTIDKIDTIGRMLVEKPRSKCIVTRGTPYRSEEDFLTWIRSFLADPRGGHEVDINTVDEALACVSDRYNEIAWLLDEAEFRKRAYEWSRGGPVLDAAETLDWATAEFRAAAAEYGELEWHGKTYALIEKAVKGKYDGHSYDQVRYYARAIDRAGKKHTVAWKPTLAWANANEGDPIRDDESNACRWDFPDEVRYG